MHKTLTQLHSASTPIEGAFHYCPGVREIPPFLGGDCTVDYKGTNRAHRVKMNAWILLGSIFHHNLSHDIKLYTFSWV